MILGNLFNLDACRVSYGHGRRVLSLCRVVRLRSENHISEKINYLQEIQLVT